MAHGAWRMAHGKEDGTQCWQHVLPLLWSAGHRNVAVTLRCAGERGALLSGAITLKTHKVDAVNVVRAKELEGLVLVGHSCGGMAVVVVADQIGNQLAHSVHADPLVPRSGERWSSVHDSATQTARRRAIAETNRLAPPDPGV